MKTEKLYQNKDWLKQKYIEERLSICRIANKYKTTNGVVKYWLKKFGITLRSRRESKILRDKNNQKNKQYCNKSWLYNKYLNEKLSSIQIAGLCEVTRETIYCWLHKFDIPLHSETEERLYQDRDWLYQKYIEERLSTIKIGKQIGRGSSIIGKWLHKFNIYRQEKYKDKNWLENKYIKEKLSMPQIGKLCNISDVSIGYWLSKFNIPIRSDAEAIHLKTSNHCVLTKEAKEWINGELLGDGCVYSINSYSATFQYGSKYLEYIQYVSDTLKSFGIEQAGKINKRYHEKSNSYSYPYSSRRYVGLLPIRERWYPNGKKIIPRDIELTSLICRQWYIGDGSLSHPKFKGKKQGNPYIRLATEGFLIEDVKWLITELKKINFKVTWQPNNNGIRISPYSTKDFLNYIGICPVKCYQYKFDY
jgi:predicted DNA-binding protein YlxM (UPF0122 family)